MSAKKIDLLLIEDSADDAELIMIELAQSGYDVNCLRVESEAQMLAALDAGKWDVVISDENLPSFSAWAALDIVNARGIDIPFLLVSGFVGEETAAALMRAGAHDFITKENLSRLAPAMARELRDFATRRERRRAQEQLEASEKFLRDVTAALGEGILVQDRSGKLLFMNPLAEILLGWPEKELMARDLHETIHCHPEGVSGCILTTLRDRGGFYKSYEEHFRRRDGQLFPVSIVVTSLLENGECVATVTAFQDISERKKMEDELRESRIQLRDLSAFLQTVREEDQKRIARELHDEMGQALTALRFDLDWLSTRIGGQEQKVHDKLGAMLGLLEKLVESMRRIAEDLRPGVLDDLGLAAAVEWHLEQFQTRSGISCRLDMSREEFELEDRIATAAFRIVQESLTNVARHAEASEVAVNLYEVGDELIVEIADNGVGFKPDKKRDRRSHYGILGMKERANSLGGELEITCDPQGAGTLVRATIPLSSSMEN